MIAARDSVRYLAYLGLIRVTTLCQAGRRYGSQPEFESECALMLRDFSRVNIGDTLSALANVLVVLFEVYQLNPALCPQPKCQRERYYSKQPACFLLSGGVGPAPFSDRRDQREQR